MAVETRSKREAKENLNLCASGLEVALILRLLRC